MLKQKEQKTPILVSIHYPTIESVGEWRATEKRQMEALTSLQWNTQESEH